MKSNNGTSAPLPGIARQLPRNIWALGLVSMFMDISSELVHSLLPIFMTSVPSATFFAGSIFAAATAIGLALRREESLT